MTTQHSGRLINRIIKRLSVLFIVVITSYVSYAQNVGINATGATPDASSMLDIVSTSRGLLIPRVALTATNTIGPITAPVTSLLVYNTATSGTSPNNVVPGYYYWSGASWSAFSTASNTAWTLSGNTGLTASNFIGTGDDKALIFKSNNASYLQFGRRATLGLTQSGYTDYTDDNEKVTYIQSALQFEAANASFYKPKMWTDATTGNFRVKGSSAGTDYFEFGSTGSSNAGGFEFIIGDDGDEPMLFKSYCYNCGPGSTGLLSEIMRLQSGRMAVGSNAFDATNPEKLLIDAGVTTSYNLMTGKGSIDNYLQINVKNSSATAAASSDLVASSDNGTETANFIDMGINSSAYNTNTYPVLNGANNAYLYAAGNDFIIGNATASKSLRFFTGGTALANERMRIDANGKVGIGNLAPSEVLDVTGNLKFSGALMPNNIPGTSGYILKSNGAGTSPTWINPSTIVGSTTSWSRSGNTGTVAGTDFIGTTDNTDLVFKTNGAETMRLISGQGVEIDAGDAGNGVASGDAISATGTYNGYFETNIQNLSTQNKASSDIVATADNGTASSFYIDMGINGSGYTTGNGNILNGANLAYLYANAGDIKIGNGTPGKSLFFFTNPTGASLGTNTANGIERMTILESGFVGIGLTTPTYQLQLSTNSAAKPGSNAWTVASDKRLKKDIKPFTDGLSAVNKINPVWFQYNGKGGMPNDGKNYVGIIAQEMKEIAPYTVGTFKDESNNEYYNYDSNAVTYILINAVKEQQTIINELKLKQQELDKKLAAQNTRLEKLENLLTTK